MLDLQPGDVFSILHIQGRLALVNKKWLLGPIPDYGAIPIPSWSQDRQMRLSIVARKTNLGPRLSCFDEDDSQLTEWMPFPTGDWDSSLPKRPWIIGDSWESFRITIQTQNRPGVTSDLARYSPNQVFFLDIAPSGGGKNLQKRVNLSIFALVSRHFQKCPAKLN